MVHRRGVRHGDNSSRKTNAFVTWSAGGLFGWWRVCPSSRVSASLSEPPQLQGLTYWGSSFICRHRTMASKWLSLSLIFYLIRLSSAPTPGPQHRFRLPRFTFPLFLPSIIFFPFSSSLHPYALIHSPLPLPPSLSFSLLPPHLFCLPIPSSSLFSYSFIFPRSIYSPFFSSPSIFNLFPASLNSRFPLIL